MRSLEQCNGKLMLRKLFQCDSKNGLNIEKVLYHRKHVSWLFTKHNVIQNCKQNTADKLIEEKVPYNNILQSFNQIISKSDIN